MTTKYCPKCETKKAVTEFNKNKSRKDGLGATCKLCNSDYKKAHYLNNKDKVYARIRARKRELVEKLWEYKRELSCADCGLVDPIVMEFDHLGDKEFNVSWMVQNGYSWQNILDEIKKCELVCANCHRRRTASRAGWYKNAVDAPLRLWYYKYISNAGVTQLAEC